MTAPHFIGVKRKAELSTYRDMGLRSRQEHDHQAKSNSLDLINHRGKIVQMETIRFQLMWAEIKAMHFDTPEGESTSGEYMNLINEIDANDPVKGPAEAAVDEILEILKSNRISLPAVVFEKNT